MFLLLDGSATGDALTDPAIVAVAPSGTGVANCGGLAVVHLIMGGTTSDGDVFNYQVTGYRTTVGPSTGGTAYMPQVIAKGAVTLGTKTYGDNAGNLGASGNLFADKITLATAYGKTTVYSPVDNTIARLLCDVSEFNFFKVETDKTTGDTLDVFWEGHAAETFPVAPRTDLATGVTTTIEYEHHEVHGGSSFACHFSNTTTNDNDHRTAIGFWTPNTAKWPHLVITVTSSHPAEFFLLEAPTIDAASGGPDLAVYNRDRNCGVVSTVLSLKNPPVAGGATSFIEAQIAAATFSGGTELEHMLLAGGKGPQAVGGSARGSQEWILKQNTKYILLLQNVGANINTHTIAADWYEHTSRG